MPRGKRKRGQFKWIIWFPDGSRYEIASIRDLTEAEIVDQFDRRLVPILNRMRKKAAGDSAEEQP